MSNCKIKKGDIVIVLSGKDKHKKGKVLQVLSQEGKVVVERVNVVKRHKRAAKNFQGGIIEKPQAIFISKVMLVCPKCGEPVKMTGKILEGKKVRACKKCGEVIDKI